MLDIAEINNTIVKLENGATTFDSCAKLASLYIVRDYLMDAVQSDETISNLLSVYNKYCENKGVSTMSALCKGLGVFILTLYGNADSEEERISMRETLQKVIAELQ